MARPVWIDERPSRRGWLAAALAALALGLIVLAVARGREPAADGGVRLDPWAAAVPAPAPRAAAVQPTAAVAVPAAAEAAAPAVHCPYQQLELAIAGARPERACVATTRVSQSGDLRSYELDPQGLSGWRLRIDSGDGAVLAAVLTAPGRGTFRCDGSACTGFMIGARDAHGGRTIEIDRAVLTRGDRGGEDSGEGGRGESTAQAQAGRDATAPATLALSARLQVPGDQLEPTLACDGPSIAIVERAGAVLTLCPSGGGSVVLRADGGRVYGLRGPAGDTLQVGVDSSGVVDLIELEDLACRGTACSGATTQPGDDPQAEGGRRFQFSGASLSDGRAGGRRATLDGSAVLPPL